MEIIQTLFLCLLFSVVSTSNGLDRSDFPPNFMFGTASSAYQYEGAWREGGKGLSNWDAFTHSPGRVEDGSNGDVADDQYHHYLEDIELMASLGLDTYRFSISWSRILPDGNGKINQAGIEYYNNFINALLQNGIQPFVTLFHFDLPNALQNSYGGWLGPQIVTDFEVYADICFKAFGDRVKYWATMNEPNMFVPLGYTVGLYPPTRCSVPFGKCISGNSLSEPYAAAHNVLLAHAAAVHAYRTKYQKIQGGSIGFVMSAPWYEPLEDTPEDRAAVDRILAFNIRWFLDPIVLGNYPSEMRERLGSRLPAIDSEMSGKLAGSFDFIGINQYTTLYASSTPTPSLDMGTLAYPDSMVYLTGERQGIPIGERTGMDGLYVVPRGIQKVVEYVTQIYNRPPIIITENGYAESKDSSATLQEALEDVRRVNFHNDYMNHLANAIRNGSDVRGYFIWSLLDNFEWAFGYTLRFGLYYVDNHSQSRYPKLSAEWVKQFLRKDAISTM
ncbi:coniferin beta-glucosidase-like [Cryptomeria japonica]|uniref:coniferin beta-glucosidase-like n=1 Tax=Cryptomeria japonica TaxID=3369 RepID=UPI0027DAA300|nr:coniferin beta-glucosidase-like [Cryptomeria japonica]